MNERKWTSGPWALTEFGGLIQEGGNMNHHIEVAGLSLAHYSKFGAKEHQVANANLIAAAPELYEALERIVTRYHKGESIDGWIGGASHALAKARGEIK